MADDILIGSDHAAIILRDAIAAALRARGLQVRVIGPATGEKADYPQVAVAVAKAVADGDAPRGILVCGTGIGMSIAANKVPGVRAALVHDPVTAELAAQHNAANVLCLGGRLLAPEYGVRCVEAWLDTTFEARHQARLDMISALERRFAAAGDPDGCC